MTKPKDKATLRIRKRVRKMEKPRSAFGTCPNIQQHAEMPEGEYLRVQWAKDKAKTHRQTQCPACGLWAIWIAKNEPKEVGSHR